MKELITKCASTNGIHNVPFAQRVLLLSHCLRPSQDCPGKMTKQGLDCTGCTRVECAIYQLRATAVEAGYGGVCIAPGGRLAVRFVDERQPAWSLSPATKSSKRAWRPLTTWIGPTAGRGHSATIAGWMRGYKS